MFETRKPTKAAVIVTCLVFLCVAGGVLSAPRLLEEISVTFKSTIGEKYSTAMKHFVHTGGERKTLVLFVHGYFGSRNAKIGTYILEYCKKNSLDFFSFDGLGFGDSTASLAAVTYTDRVNQIKELVEEYLLKGFNYSKIVLAGHSLGGYVSFGAARDIRSLNQRMVGMLLIAPAVLFSNGDLDLYRGNISPAQQATLDGGDFVNFNGIIITTKILNNFRENSPTLRPNTNLNYPVKFIWGTADTTVPIKYSQNVLPYTTPASKVELTQIEGADHLFLRDSDKEVVYKKLGDLIAAGSRAFALLALTAFGLSSGLILAL
jgi:pimeloyl-ACP methyl ester carboxylesterase